MSAADLAELRAWLRAHHVPGLAFLALAGLLALARVIAGVHGR